MCVDDVLDTDIARARLEYQSIMKRMFWLVWFGFADGPGMSIAMKPVGPVGGGRSILVSCGSIDCRFVHNSRNWRLWCKLCSQSLANIMCVLLYRT